MLMSVPVTLARTKDNVQMGPMDTLVSVLENTQEISVKIVKHHILVFIRQNIRLLYFIIHCSSVYNDIKIRINIVLRCKG